MKRTAMKRSRKPLWSKKTRDWPRMTEDAHTNSGGRCEICEEPIPMGTYPAHIIPRSNTKESSDESWNIGGLCIVPNNCHTKFDADRHGFFADWGKGTRLYKRIEKDNRLRAYFERLVSVAIGKGFLVFKEGI